MRCEFLFGSDNQEKQIHAQLSGNADDAWRMHAQFAGLRRLFAVCGKLFFASSAVRPPVQRVVCARSRVQTVRTLVSLHLLNSVWIVMKGECTNCSEKNLVHAFKVSWAQCNRSLCCMQEALHCEWHCAPPCAARRVRPLRKANETHPHRTAPRASTWPVSIRQQQAHARGCGGAGVRSCVA
jgi:hypothetical protein